MVLSVNIYIHNLISFDLGTNTCNDGVNYKVLVKSMVVLVGWWWWWWWWWLVMYGIASRITHGSEASTNSLFDGSPPWGTTRPCAPRPPHPLPTRRLFACLHSTYKRILLSKPLHYKHMIPTLYIIINIIFKSGLNIQTEYGHSAWLMY